jgi:predicted nucleic acid-binding protein
MSAWHSGPAGRAWHPRHYAEVDLQDDVSYASGGHSPILGLAAVHYLLASPTVRLLEIPLAVFSELKTQTNFRGAEEVAQALRDGWIAQVEVRDVSLVKALAMDLDRGEAEAIALALQRGRTQILIDESDGRARAKAMGLKPIGVLGILLQAKKTSQIHSVRQAMLALRQEIGFYISDELFSAILAQAGEE